MHLINYLSSIKTIFYPKNIITCARIELYINKGLNLNTGFDLNKNIDYKIATENFEKDFSHQDLINMLNGEKIPEIQFAAIKLDCVNNQDEAKLLVKNLTGCDGKIREAVAYKINQLLYSNSDRYAKFFSKFPVDFANASIDINSNICRLVIDSVILLKDYGTFREKYSEKILKFIKETFDELDKFVYKDKKYVINKQLFKLYWSLEALNILAEYIDKNLLFAILSRASGEREYTIREKAAKIIVKLPQTEFPELREILKKDENYYVRQVFKP